MEDIKLAQAIFIDNIAILKGKLTHKQTPIGRLDYINILKQIYAKYGNIELEWYIMEINKIYFLTSINTTIKYHKVVGIRNKSSKVYYDAIDIILHVYNSTGFMVTKTNCDNKYKTLLNDIKDDLNIDVTYVNT